MSNIEQLQMYLEKTDMGYVGIEAEVVAPVGDIFVEYPRLGPVQSKDFQM